MPHQLIIAAPSSNSGKTTVTIGLLRALVNRGLSVQPFKCGPDFIDTKFHTIAAQRPAINLDTFMMGPVHMQETFANYACAADVSVIEGVMGLFDGAERMKGSSAEIAALLNVPVVLVVNARAMAYSVAPLLYGFKNFDKRITVAGVIFNQVNTESHYQFLKEAAADAGVASLGYIPTNEAIRIPSRHLGLSTNAFQTDDAQRIADHLQKTVDLDTLLAISACNEIKPVTPPRVGPDKHFTIAVARDEAFSFIYHQNLESLQARGQVVFFSPLHDGRLPPADLLYLPGGYPELYAEQLSDNTDMRDALYTYCSAGGRVLAECGGMMYLGKTIADTEGRMFPMVSFLDLETSMAEAKLTLGYRKVQHGGHKFFGHEFHYSQPKETGVMSTIGSVVSARDQAVNLKIYRKGNVVASYMHFYWGGNAAFLDEIFS